MNRPRVELKFRAPFATPESRGGQAPRYRVSIDHGMRIERDVAIRLRDGVEIYADVHRPLNDESAAPIIAWGPYGKHVPNQPERYLPGAVDPQHLSPRTAFEAPNPDYWVPAGYAVVNVDPRGMWHSGGRASYLSEQEADDFYDVIEWSGTQPWSNGKVGLSGVSYLASSQWRVAGRNPPHLAAINPWEGWSDTYREVVYHGGVPDSSFWTYIAQRWGASSTAIEDLALETREHPFFDDFWASKAARFGEIRVPAYVVASWTDQGLHTRGTLEGFKGIASPRKWLEVHGRKKWAYYYEPESVARQRVFFDHFLKGIENEIRDWPPVLLEARERHYVGGKYAEQEWPIARTRYTKLFLDGESRTLRLEAPARAGLQSYDAADKSATPDHAEFEFRFAKRTDVVGHMALHVYVEARGADDMDLFVGIQKRDASGAIVPFPYCAQFDNGPVALGWLRASHRELDPRRSTPQQPVLSHQRLLPVPAGSVIEVDVEIWPSGTRFEAGEALVLIVQGSEINKSTAIAHYKHENTVNRGRHVVHTGDRHPSHLLIPIVPDLGAS
ncbi:MAG: CocE/NonD family hydrolase [Betaproteobacteria bacterium]|nr:CocE/NonD family hydrolase [Betaproteobacteria bacterium]